MKIIVGLILALPLVGQTVVQFKECDAIAPLTCAFTSPVTAGNFLVATMAKTGVAESCQSGGENFSDTLGSVFTAVAVGFNPTGASAVGCIVVAKITASGADTVSKGGTEFQRIWIHEVSGLGYNVYTLGTSVNSTTNSSTTVATGNVTHTIPKNVLLVCVAGTSNPDPFISVQPDTGTFTPGPNDGGGAGADYFDFVPAGTYDCTFTTGVAATRLAAAGALFTGRAKVMVIRAK